MPKTKVAHYIDREIKAVRKPYAWRPAAKVRRLVQDLARKLDCSVNEAISAAVMKAVHEERLDKKTFKLRESR